MNEAVEAIYENGVFRPLQPVELNNGERVKLMIGKAKLQVKDDGANLPELAIDMGVSDLAKNIDHYLYGLPKQQD